MTSNLFGRDTLAGRDAGMPGNITQIINIKATIMSLTLLFPSIDHLQAN